MKIWDSGSFLPAEAGRPCVQTNRALSGAQYVMFQECLFLLNLTERNTCQLECAKEWEPAVF